MVAIYQIFRITLSSLKPGMPMVDLMSPSILFISFQCPERTPLCFFHHWKGCWHPTLYILFIVLAEQELDGELSVSFSEVLEGGVEYYCNTNKIIKIQTEKHCK